MGRNRRTKHSCVTERVNEENMKHFLPVFRIQHWEYENKWYIEINLRLCKFLSVFNSLYLIELA